jgi:hypothetical protein
MVFVGFEDRSKATRYWDKATRKIKVSRNVAFNENEELTGLEEARGYQLRGRLRRIQLQHQHKIP